MVHLPLVGHLVIPEQTLTVLGFLIEIAQFDVVENELVYGELVDFPADQDELLRRSFVETGYESNYAFVNMGTNVIVITILIFFKVLLLLFLPCRRQDNCIGRAHKKCSGIIFWNFWLRLIIQGCLEISIACCVYLIDRQQYVDLLENGYGTFLLINDILSFVFFVTIAIAPLWIILFYCSCFKKFKDERFASTYGSPISGLRKDRRSVIFQPVYFLLRRFAFLYIALFWGERPSNQIHFLILTHVFAALYKVHFRPYETNLLQSLEVFNEFTSLVLLYATIGFLHFPAEYLDPVNPQPQQTDQVDELPRGEIFTEQWFMLESEEMRGNLGWIFNGLIGMNVCVHLYFLI